jgi:hypothetical protein
VTTEYELYQGWMALHGTSLPPHRIEQAVTADAELAPQLRELRAIEFEFLSDVIEPATANQWIEQGGRS